jgi:hypothetical protein
MIQPPVADGHWTISYEAQKHKPELTGHAVIYVLIKTLQSSKLAAQNFELELEGRAGAAV